MDKKDLSQSSCAPVTNLNPPRQDPEQAYLHLLPFSAILLLANPIAATKMVQSAIKVYRQNFLLPTKLALVWTCSSLRARYCNNRYILRWRCFFQFQKLDLVCLYLKITGSNWNNKNKIKIKRLKIRKLKISW